MSLLALPSELMQMILIASFGPCLLRRHVVAHLQQMHFTAFNQDTPTQHVNYTADVHDSDIRASAPLDARERFYYDMLKRNVQLLGPYLTLHWLVAESIWLRRQPMDYRNFKHFCNHPLASRYEDRDYLALELFSEANFFDPPPGITTIDAADRTFLAQRATLTLPGHGLYLLTLDTKICEGLLDLWNRAMPSLPPQVKKVQAIANMATVSNLGPGLPPCLTDPLNALSQALQGFDTQRRIQYRGMLFRGANIRE